MSLADLVVILLIANAVQNTMVGPDVSVPGGLIAAGALLGANAVLGRFEHRLPWLVLISDGAIVARQMAREGIEPAELAQAAREHGLAGLEDVKQAVLEVDGTFSIVPQSSKTIRTKRRVGTRRQT